MSVTQNITELNKSIPSGVTLVAVSKTKPDKLILEAYETGHRDFGENYVQELVEKASRLPKDIRWHFIGHLQTNKVKSILPVVHLVHGVDSLKLLVEINKQAFKINKIIDCLLQIFISGEETKFGFSFEECEKIFNSGELQNLKNIKVKGFMGMASNTDNFEQIKREFASLKIFHTKIQAGYFELPLLSFGMSSDYKIALECGSNMLRIGSTIFGERIYPK